MALLARAAEVVMVVRVLVKTEVDSRGLVLKVEMLAKPETDRSVRDKPEKGRLELAKPDKDRMERDRLAKGRPDKGKMATLEMEFKPERGRTGREKPEKGKPAKAKTATVDRQPETLEMETDAKEDEVERERMDKDKLDKDKTVMRGKQPVPLVMDARMATGVKEEKEELVNKANLVQTGSKTNKQAKSAKALELTLPEGRMDHKASSNKASEPVNAVKALGQVKLDSKMGNRASKQANEAEALRPVPLDSKMAKEVGKAAKTEPAQLLRKDRTQNEAKRGKELETMGLTLPERRGTTKAKMVRG
ncbi:hypothetical protein JOL62DRAFT_199232 [Phyllosticta paracitricarpa]|uniref:Uncharacterized protein n=1 Tax=Phyllosticta paracitricarpa TaxID=2016321 RepID=A0ABR1N3I4_9PEZI